MTVSKQKPFTTKNTNEWQTEHPWEQSPISSPRPIPLVKESDLFNSTITIRDVMKRDTAICAADATVGEAVRILRDSASSAVFLVSDGRPIGMLTVHRVALAVAEHGENLSRLRAQELMNPNVLTVPAGAKLTALLDGFADEGVAVLDESGRMQGVVRWIELLGALSERALGRLVGKLFSAPRES